MKNGFTIIEIIIAIFILSIAVIGIYSAFSLLVFLTYDSSDRLTAAYLSQEGIEIIRNIRDTNWLYFSSWETYIADTDSPCFLGCEADFRTSPNSGTNLVIYNSGDYLNIDNDGFYSYSDTGTVKPTKFKRKITITCFPDENNCDTNIAIKVVSEVIWDTKPNIFNPILGTYSFKTDEILYDWY